MNEPFKFNPEGELIYVKATLVGPKKEFTLRLALDTGASLTTLNTFALVMAGYDPATSPHRVELTTGSGLEYVPYLRIGKITALGQTREDFPVIAHTLPPSATVDGLLGLDFFRDRQLTIDFRKGLLCLD